MSTPSYRELTVNGLWKNNPALVQLLGLCPLLGVSNSAVNALGLGLATMLVLTCSNIGVSLVRGVVNTAVRLPAFVMIIAALTTCIELLMQAFTYELYQILGIFIPLITTNCVILGRADGFAAKHNPLIAGFDGLVICMRNSFTDIEVEGSTVRAGAGVQLPKLARTASRAGIAGFGFLVGIPGSVGGGTAMNAGLAAKGRREISTILEAATVVDLTSGETATVPAAELGLDYRQSNLAEKRWMVTEVVFRGPSLGDPKELMSEIRSHMADRHAKQPLDRRTAGSTFKQPAGGAAAGWYIENAGLKGCRIGSAVISHKHANWIENTGAATSDDIRNLVEHIQESVASRFDVALDPEVTFLI